MEVTWNRNSLLGLEELNVNEINLILKLSKEFKNNLSKKQKPSKDLEGKRIVNLFMEPSTRTRVAFEIAAKSLSADVISIASKSSSLTKGESLKDTALNIQALGADAIVILTEWGVFKEIDWFRISSIMRKPSWLFDTRFCTTSKTLLKIGL